MPSYARHWLGLPKEQPRPTPPAKDRERSMPDAILELLARPEHRTRGCLWVTIEREIDCSVSTLVTHVRQLREAGLVRHARKGDPYIITSAGLERLEEE